MTRIVFIDTETTSLRPDRRAWEIGLIVREPGKTDTEHQWFIDVRDLDLGNADVMSLRIGRFYERHPQIVAEHLNGDGKVLREDAAMRQVEKLTRGAHLVGAVVSFDADVLGQRMRANGICPSWHYHLVDVEALAAGWLQRHAAVLENREATIDEATYLRVLASPPWKSDDLSAALGIKVSDEDRHTALGDAKWARSIYDEVTGRTA
jgi:DNA polymerase III epsilon subunit-like protein